MGFFSSSPSKVQPVAPAPTVSDQDVQDAAVKERLRLAAAKGRSSTIRTSGQGVTEEVSPNVKKLLGV